MGAKRKPRSVLEAAESGDHRALLVALRDLIARTIDEQCAARDLVGLSKRLLDLAAELRTLDLRTETGPNLQVVDETFDPSAV
jgi:hypothetical protein